MGWTSLPAHPSVQPQVSALPAAALPCWHCCQDKLLWLLDRLCDSRNKALLTRISAFPGLPNWCKCRGKTAETTEQACRYLEAEDDSKFSKEHRVMSATKKPNRYQYFPHYISSWKEEESAQNRLSPSNNLSRSSLGCCPTQSNTL